MNPGELYHVYNRGNNKENIFKAGANYDYFLQLFDRHLSKLTYLHAYCLMPNHFHLLVEVRTSIEGDTDSFNDNGKLKPVEKGFKNFFIAYVKAINRVYGRTGSLFQSKFKRKLIEGEFQYQTNVAYIHLNPVKANLCMGYEDWYYSSYNRILRVGKQPQIAREKVIARFGSREEFLAYHKLYKQSVISKG